MNSTPVGSVRRMISAALLSRSGRSETVSWQVCCAVNIAPTEGLFDSFLRRAILPILGRSRKALFPYRESYKFDETLRHLQQKGERPSFGVSASQCRLAWRSAFDEVWCGIG